MTTGSVTPTVDPSLRRSYGWFMPITTRWMDNDIYGHINNVHYYSYFDTVANTFLIQKCGLDIHHGAAIGYIVHSQCSYKQGIAFPEAIEGGFRVNRIGNSSIQYGIGIFKSGENSAAAYGTFTHVFVDRATETPVSIPEAMRPALEAMLATEF
ncbi:thioesterase family protein [Halioxenophilus sp. WMMB6]|uniref:acyl-CoA thioesterase n=1 Tax=Halioxenophilus sp. WMMB6 TaxID=3073815 RepID=UPI00295EE1ED|nr:thioesterase family protein [Halioxenophilus sp. WMMB6]